MSVLLGLDVGTSGIKALACRADGEIIARITVEYPLHHPHPGWAEQEPEDWWNATLEALRQISAALGTEATDVRGMALSGQMHGSVFLDENGKSLRPAILWCDVRTTPQCQYITDKIGRRNLLRYVSNPALEGFTAPKIVWLMQNEPGVFARTRWVVLPKDYVRYRLTGEILTEMSDAAGTILFDVCNRRWSDEVLTALEIPRELMPDCRESIDVCGYLREDIAGVTGLPAGIPVGGGGADNACGAVGAGIVKAGRTLSSIGSSGVIVAQTDEAKTDPRAQVHTFNHAIPQTWYIMGVMLAAGLSYKWLRDNLGHMEVQMEELTGIDAYTLLDREAEQAPAGSEGLIFLPYLNGERTPHGDGYAKGVFFGLTPRHGKQHLVRAVMEGVVFGLRDSIEIVRDLGIDVSRIRAIGGGAKSSLWRRMQADIMNVEVATLNVDEGPAFGAAILAGVAAGVFDNVEEAAENMVHIKEITEPDEKMVRRYEGYYQLFRSLYPALKDRFKAVSELIADI